MYRFFLIVIIPCLLFGCSNIIKTDTEVEAQKYSHEMYKVINEEEKTANINYDEYNEFINSKSNNNEEKLIKDKLEQLLVYYTLFITSKDSNKDASDAKNKFVDLTNELENDYGLKIK